MKLIKKLFLIGFVLSVLAMTFLAGIITNDVLSDPEVIIRKDPCFPYVLPPVAKETPPKAQPKEQPKAQPKAQPVPIEEEEEKEEDDWEEEWELKLKIEEEKRETLRQVQEMEIENEKAVNQLEQSQKEFDAYWRQRHSQQLWDKAMELAEESEESLERLENYTPPNIYVY